MVGLYELLPCVPMIHHLMIVELELMVDVALVGLVAVVDTWVVMEETAALELMGNVLEHVLHHDWNQH